MYVNVGAYVDEATLIDSHALVGSCAQIGKRVHLSAAAQIGGVLEPVGASPVIIEDDVLIGGNCGVYEGTQVRSGAVLGAGTILTRATPVYDIVREHVYRSSADAPLIIPENAVVVPGSRAITKGKAAEWGLSLYTPVIVKYRDDKTQGSIELEELAAVKTNSPNQGRFLVAFLALAGIAAVLWADQALRRRGHPSLISRQ